MGVSDHFSGRVIHICDIEFMGMKHFSRTIVEKDLQGSELAKVSLPIRFILIYFAQMPQRTKTDVDLNLSDLEPSWR
jgi:hypothetical protein